MGSSTLGGIRRAKARALAGLSMREYLNEAVHRFVSILEFGTFSKLAIRGANVCCVDVLETDERRARFGDRL